MQSKQFVLTILGIVLSFIFLSHVVYSVHDYYVKEISVYEEAIKAGHNKIDMNLW